MICANEESILRLATCMQREADTTGLVYLLLDQEEPGLNRESSVVIPYAIAERDANAFHRVNWVMRVRPGIEPETREVQNG